MRLNLEFSNNECSAREPGNRSALVLSLIFEMSFYKTIITFPYFLESVQQATLKAHCFYGIRKTYQTLGA